MTPDELTELFSQFMINSWSYSKVTTFARNEKAFEMQYIYGVASKRSASEVAGSAYHKALQLYFTAKKEGRITDIVMMQEAAYSFIDEIEPNKWKLQKTTRSVSDCIAKATQTATVLINNFYAEKNVYDDSISEIIGVELKWNTFITINGVDIPLPCHGITDLIFRTHDGKIVIADHKSKSAFTGEKEIKFVIGRQAITYAKLYESVPGNKVDEVWFVENKVSTNKDKSSQIVPFKVSLDTDTRKLYEALLYEPLKKMLQALSDPDYVYVINDSDNLSDTAEIYDFWAQTMISEVSDFNVPEDKRALVGQRLKKIRDASLATINPNVVKNFRKNAAEFIQYDLSNKDMTNEQKIEHTLRTLGIIVKVQHCILGYSCNTYLMELSAGTPISSLYRYSLDIAGALNLSNIRMMKDLLVYQGKSYVAIECAKAREKNLAFQRDLQKGTCIPLGRDNFANLIEWDLDNPSTPHVLICGSTGSGKSVCIITIIEYARIAGIDTIVIFDPKHEFKEYKGVGIEVFNDIEEIEAVMSMMVDEMNTLVKKGVSKKTLIVFDEFADAVANSRKGAELDRYETVTVGVYKTGLPKTKRVKTGSEKSLEDNLRILLQKGRSSGFRIVAATQRASVNVITGDAKVNFPVQICFKVPKEVDSKVVLDEGGAEVLTGKGDGLIKSPVLNGVVRFQAFYKG